MRWSSRAAIALVVGPEADWIQNRNFIHNCGYPAYICPENQQIWGCLNPDCHGFVTDSPTTHFVEGRKVPSSSATHPITEDEIQYYIELQSILG